jgi:hypothetical protein
MTATNKIIGQTGNYEKYNEFMRAGKQKASSYARKMGGRREGRGGSRSGLRTSRSNSRLGGAGKSFGSAGKSFGSAGSSFGSAGSSFGGSGGFSGRGGRSSPAGSGVFDNPDIYISTKYGGTASNDKMWDRWAKDAKQKAEDAAFVSQLNPRGVSLKGERLSARDLAMDLAKSESMGRRSRTKQERSDIMSEISAKYGKIGRIRSAGQGRKVSPEIGFLTKENEGSVWFDPG